MSEAAAGRDDLEAGYLETETERLLVFERAGDEDAPARVAAIAQNREGYAMLAVREGGPDGVELERYYGLEMALDHVAELLGVPPAALPVPPEGRDMGM